MSTYLTIVHFPFLTFSALTFSLHCAILLSKKDLPLIVARRLYSWGFTCGKSSFLYSTAIPSLERRLFIYVSSGENSVFYMLPTKKPKRSLLFLCKHHKENLCICILKSPGQNHKHSRQERIGHLSFMKQSHLYSSFHLH